MSQLRHLRLCRGRRAWLSALPKNRVDATTDCLARKVQPETATEKSSAPTETPTSNLGRVAGKSVYRPRTPFDEGRGAFTHGLARVSENLKGVRDLRVRRAVEFLEARQISVPRPRRTRTPPGIWHATPASRRCVAAGRCHTR
jgi:hypothetical protein